MGRRQIFYNPTNFIHWQTNLVLVTQSNMTLVDTIRLLIDQATGSSAVNLPDYPTPGDIFWPAQQLYDCGNEVLIDMWSAFGRQNTPIQLTNTDFVVSSGTDIFPYNATAIMIPSYVVLNTTTSSGAASQTIDQRYWTSDITKLEQWSNNWRQNIPAQPKWFLTWDAFHLRCFPSPDQTYTFTLFGVPWPTELSTGTEDITADPVFKLAVAYKAAANVLEYSRPDTADSYLKESEELLNRYRIRLRNQETNNMRRFRPVVAAPGGQGTDLTMAATKGVIRIGRRTN